MTNARETPPPPLLVNGREARRLFDASERTLFNLRKRGLPCVWVGNALKYDPADVLAWLKANGSAAKTGDAK